MNLLRRLILAQGRFSFVFFIAGVGTLPSIFYFQRFANNLEEAALIILVPFMVSVMLGVMLVKVSKVSREDISERRAEIRENMRSRFKKMPAYQKVLVVIGIIAVFIIFNAGDFLSLTD